jgi:uncharacterized protein YbbC (DUF1343 family)
MTALSAGAISCSHQTPPDPVPPVKAGAVRTGITVLLDDSIALVRDKRVGLLTNQTGTDERGLSDIELLTTDKRAVAARVKLVSILAPEHGLAGTDDRTNLPNGREPRTGLPVFSLYGATTMPPPDSALDSLDVIVVDLQDIGTRTWTRVGAMVYTMRAAARRRIPIIVLDRPNPLGGTRAEGPVLDTTLANADDPTAGKPGRAYALYPVPLRHGMTIGELALLYNERLQLGAELHVIAMRGWRRVMWLDDTGIAWVQPSPNIPTLASALVYPALVPLEGTNVSVGRGTPESFQQFGASWLNAKAVAVLLSNRELAGVRFETTSFTPNSPSDAKFAGRKIPGVRIVVTDRERVQMSRVGAAIVHALGRLHADSLRVDTMAFDLRFGSPAARRALLRGDDPDEVMDRQLPALIDFERRARALRLYR